QVQRRVQRTGGASETERDIARERTGLLQFAVGVVGVFEREATVVVRVTDRRDEVRGEIEGAVTDEAHTEDADRCLDGGDGGRVREEGVRTDVNARRRGAVVDDVDGVARVIPHDAQVHRGVDG